MNQRTGNKSNSNPAFRPLGTSGNAAPAYQKFVATLVVSMLTLAVIAGCASTKVTNRENLVSEQLPHPAHIWVYDFVSSAADIPSNSSFYGQNLGDAPVQTTEHIETGRKLGAQIAAGLVKQIQDMGLPAEHATPGTTAQVNDIEIRGYLMSFTEGSAAKRVRIGLGAGSSELKAAVEAFQMTSDGLRKIGSGATEATGSKTPGMAVGLASLLATHNPAGLIVSTGMKVYGEKSGRSTVEGRANQVVKEVADALKTRFRQQGWIE